MINTFLDCKVHISAKDYQIEEMSKKTNTNCSSIKSFENVKNFFDFYFLQCRQLGGKEG